MIKEFYHDKTILLTGTTGYVGKVVLEKFLRSLPTFKKIFVLVRLKRGTAPMERVWKDIFSSQCFDVVRALPDFEHTIKTKIVPIEGDITKDLLAIKPADRDMLISELDVIINIAASVDFNEQLTDALQINYFGCLRMLDLAQSCKKLQIYTHVSTCYVNCEKFGYIKEQIYDIPEDSEVIVDGLMKMSKPEQE